MYCDMNASTSDGAPYHATESRCGVCFQQYLSSEDASERKPRTLNCGHNYCTGCLKKLLQGKERLDCPQCEQQTRVRRGIDNLPVSRGILTEIYSVRTNHGPVSRDVNVHGDLEPAASASSSTTGRKRKAADAISCQSCEKAEATCYCSSCRNGGEYCSTCWDHVELHKGSNSSHKKQPMHEKPVTCSMQLDCRPDVSCNVDQSISSDRCHLVGSHENQNVKDPNLLSRAKIQEMKQMVQSMQDLQAKLHKKADGLQQAITIIERRGDSMRENAFKQQKRILATLQTAINALLANTAIKEALCLEPMDMLQDQTQDAIDRVSRALEKMNGVLEAEQQDGDAEKFSLEATKMLQVCSAIQAEVSTVLEHRLCPKAGQLDGCYHPETIGPAEKGFNAIHRVLRDLTPKAPYQTCIELATMVDDRSPSTSAAVWRCFQQMGSFNAKAAGLYNTNFESSVRYDHGCLFCRNCMSAESLNRLLQHVYNFLSDSSRLSDPSAEGRARVRGALVALLLVCSACSENRWSADASLPKPWVDMGGLSVIAGILSDTTQPDGVVDLALSCIVPYTFQADVSEADLLVCARMHAACMVLLRRYVVDAGKHVAATRVLCKLVLYASNDCKWIGDAVVLTLVQSLQRLVDHPKIASMVHSALQKLSAVPDGKTALQSSAVRQAFASALKQEYPHNYSSSYFWDHATSIARLIYRDGARNDLKASVEVTDIIQASLGFLTHGLLRPRGPERIALGAALLKILGAVHEYADEITRQGGTRVCIGLMRVLQNLRFDYWQQDGFLDLLLTVCCSCWTSSPTGAVARAQFISLRGCELLMQVLGDETTARRPVDTVEKVLVLFYILCHHEDSKSAVKMLPKTSRETIKRAMHCFAKYLNKQHFWTKMNANAKLLAALNRV